MLRILSPTTRRQGRVAKLAATASLSIFTAIGVSGVSAESLAQPRDTSLEEAAAAYIAYREDVAFLESEPFDSAETTREAHRRLSAHDGDALTTGWVAYAALVAADTPEFAAALQAEVEEKKKRSRKQELTGRDAFFAKLASDPRYPRTLAGSNAAISKVMAMTIQDSLRFATLGEAYKTQAYAMQKTNWGKAKIGSSSTRLSDAESYAAKRPAAAAPAFNSVENKGVVSPALASLDGAWSSSWGKEGAVKASASEPNADAVIDRVLNLAARYAVGATNPKIVEVYAQNTKSSQCLSMAKLTLDQCIAATRTPYEEAFCLGEHALIDTAQCVGWVAGVDAGS
jgi:hypothetical protein